MQCLLNSPRDLSDVIDFKLQGLVKVQSVMVCEKVK